MGGARERMLAKSQLTPGTIYVGGTATSVLEGGKGPPMVLLHGGIECGSVIWTPVTARLVPDYRVIAPDLPGLGESTVASRIDLDSFSAWLTGILAELGAVKPILVAHSLTGGLAARFAAGHAPQLSRLVVYASPGVVRYRTPLSLRYRAMRFAVRPTRRNLERFQRFALFDRESAKARDPGWFDAFSEYSLARAQAANVRITLGHLFRTLAKEMPRDELTRIGVPTALVWGRHDRMVPFHMAESASARYHWPLLAVDGAGHVPHIERPEKFVDALLAACAGL